MKKLFRPKLNNKGMTLAEMLVTFILLGIFMVAATRVISYTIGIYYAAKGNINGYQVSCMLYDKISGELENATEPLNGSPKVSADKSTITYYNSSSNLLSLNISNEASKGDIRFAANDYKFPDDKKYLKINYSETQYQGVKYDAVDWYYDTKVYMGYWISDLRFENPNVDAEGLALTDSNGNPLYDENIIRMKMTVTSGKYGDFTTTYYLKCNNCSKVDFL